MDQIDKLAEALAKAQGAMSNPRFNAKNYYGRGYADLSAIIEAIRKPLSDNGLAWVQIVDNVDGKPMLITTLMHSSGQTISSRQALPVGNVGPQQFGSALTYARRYGLSAITGIAADVDDDAEVAEGRGGMEKQQQQTIPPEEHPQQKAPSGEIITPAQVEKLRTAMALRDIKDDRVLDYASLEAKTKIDKIEFLPVDIYNKCMTRVRAVAATKSEEHPA